MRIVIGKLLALIERYPPLVDGAFIIIFWVGAKLLLEFLAKEGFVHFEIPKWLSLGLIGVIFALSFLFARRQDRRKRLTKTEDAAKRLLAEEERST